MTPATMRVRFAPSPTGTLHIGSARSALYNWLAARNAGAEGTYVLRIEDTDLERSTPENVEQALAVFRWLGLDWDEGPGVDGPYAPYFQSQRGEHYRAALAELVAAKRVYPCFCTREQLDADRSAQQAQQQPIVYAGRCRDLSEEEQQSRMASGAAYVMRFRADLAATTTFTDLILGELSFENALIGDTVIARQDGSPLYNFANVVDDAEMRITCVIRGNDHVSNTPKQIMLYEALGVDVPAFAHVPMILGPDGAKLSKRRHHTADVEQLAAAGYLPAAVRNGLALLGWNRDEQTTVMTTEELIKAFDITRVRKSPAAVDYDKLRHINAVHLRDLSAAAWADAYAAWRSEWIAEDDERYAAAWAAEPMTIATLIQEKVDVLSDVPALMEFLVEPFSMTEQAWERLGKSAEAPAVLERVDQILADLSDFSAVSIEHALRELCTQMELKPGKAFAPIRFAVTGRTVTPGLFECIEVLGRDRARDRIAQARTRLASVLAQ